MLLEEDHKIDLNGAKKSADGPKGGLKIEDSLQTGLIFVLIQETYTVFSFGIVVSILALKARHLGLGSIWSM